MDQTLSTAVREEDQRQRGMANALSPHLSYLGDPWDANVFRFGCTMDTLRLLDDVKAWKTLRWNCSARIHEVAAVAAFIARSPRAELVSCKLQVFASALVGGGQMVIRSAFNSAADGALGEDDDYDLQPSVDVSYSTPLGGNGVPPPYIREMEAGQYGIQKQIKPLPLVGGAPRVNVRVAIITPNDLAKNSSVGMVRLTLVVRRY